VPDADRITSHLRRAIRATNLRPDAKPEGHGFSRANIAARKARFRSADGLSAAHSAQRTIIALSPPHPTHPS
jgi:hypothetical protein